MIDFDTLIEDIRCGLIIPIIGDEVLYVATGSGSEKLQEYIVKQLQKKVPEPGFDEMKYSFKNMAWLERAIGNRRMLVREIDKILSGQKVELDPCILQFLRNGDFPLILTTSYTDALERALPEYKSVDYYCEKDNDIGEIAESDKHKRLAQKTIFHLFGRIDRSGILPCVVTENDFLKYLHSLSDSYKAPERLLRYIQIGDLERREIFALGCGVPDWVFRFLLYSMIKEPLFRKGDSGVVKGGIIDSANNLDLASFLHNIDYYYGNNILDFINELNKSLQPIYRPSIFVSIRTADLTDPLIGRKLRDRIEQLKKQFDIWFCEDRLQGYAGETYWEEIRRGLQECDYFMPIITPSVLLRVGKVSGLEPMCDREEGFITEWKYALESWRTDHAGNLRYTLPARFGVEVSVIQDTFNDCDNVGLHALRPLVLGQEGMGCQIADIVNNIDTIQLDYNA